jgi:hypothetical protein
MTQFETEWEFLVPLTEVKLTLFSNWKFMQLIKYTTIDCVGVELKAVIKPLNDDQGRL